MFGGTCPFRAGHLRKISNGQQCKILGAEPTKSKITFASDDVLIADWGRTQLSIQRETGAITTINNGIMRTHNDKVMKFRM